MKINKTKRPLARRIEQDEDDDASVGKKYGWMATNPKDQDRSLQESISRSARNRPPELWIKDREEKLVRFRQAGALGTFSRYRMQVDGKWRAFTRPAEGEVDLFASELGLNATFAAVYEVVDINGYKDDQGKRHRFIPRFYVVGGRQFEQLRLIKKKRGPLCNYDITISRSGSGTQTSYAYLPELESPADPKVKAAASLANDVMKYYGPPSEAEQRIIVNKLRRTAGVTDSDTDDDDDDE